MLKLVLVVALMLLVMPQAMAVDINVNDGSINDWGLSQLTGDWSDENTWIPTIDGVSFFVEDNQDPFNTAAANYNASYTGVHIYGNRTYQTVYREPLLAGTWAEPYGGERYDIEAMYVTENTTHIFVLIIFSELYPYWASQGLPSELADLALDLDFNPATGGYGYEYGVNLHRLGNQNGQKYGIYATPNDSCWTVPSPFIQNKPAEINFSVVNASNILGYAIVSYFNLNKDDFGKSNFAVEIAIPKSAVGNPTLSNNPSEALKRFWISERCGNEAGPTISEFLTILIPAGIVIGVMIYIRGKK